MLSGDCVGRSEGYRSFFVLGKARRSDRNSWISVLGVPVALNSSSVLASFNSLFPHWVESASCIENRATFDQSCQCSRRPPIWFLCEWRVVYFYLVLWVWTWRCSHRLFSSLWFGFPKHLPTGGCDIVVLVAYFQKCGRTCAVLLVRLELSFFLITFARSYPLSPATCSQVEHPCLILLGFEVLCVGRLVWRCHVVE